MQRGFEAAVDIGAQFVGGIGRQFGFGQGGPGRGAGVLAPEFQPVQTRAGQVGAIVGQQAINLAERVIGSTIGVPGLSADLGDIWAKWPGTPPIIEDPRFGRGLGVLAPGVTQPSLPAGPGANERIESKAAAAARMGVENLQTAGIGGLVGGTLLGLGIEQAAGAIVGGIKGLFGGGDEGMARDVTVALPGGRSVEVSLPLGGALFRPTMGGLRPASVVVIPNPLTGKPTFFGHLGNPVLFRRDLIARKKVNRLAASIRRGR